MALMGLLDFLDYEVRRGLLTMTHDATFMAFRLDYHARDITIDAFNDAVRYLPT